MEGAGGRVAVETTGGAVERSAVRPAGPEVHQPGDSARENLAVSSPARANNAPESGRTEESLSGRVESSPGVCAVGPPGGSDEARDRTAHGLATAQRARLPVGGPAETRVQAALVLARRRARVPAQRLSCSRKAWKRCFCPSRQARHRTKMAFEQRVKALAGGREEEQLFLNLRREMIQL